MTDFNSCSSLRSDILFWAQLKLFGTTSRAGGFLDTKKKAYHLSGMIRLQNSDYFVVLQSAVKRLKNLDITGFCFGSSINTIFRGIEI